MNAPTPITLRNPEAMKENAAAILEMKAGDLRYYDSPTLRALQDNLMHFIGSPQEADARQLSREIMIALYA